jgi:multiple sugar transport system permease protein
MKFGVASRYLYIIPALAAILFVGVYPLVYTVYSSFSWYKLLPPVGPNFPTVQNYLGIFQGAFTGSLVTTLIIWASTLTLEFLIGFLGALAFVGSDKITATARILVSGPCLMSSVIAGMLWKYFFYPKIGPVSLLLNAVGVAGDPPLNTAGVSTAAITIIIADVWQWTPLVLLILLSGVMAIPHELTESAEIDGMSWFSKLRYIILPNMQGVFIIALLLRGTLLFSEFDKIFILTRGGPGTTTMTLVYRSYEAMFGGGYNIGEATAWAVIILIIVNIFVMASTKTIKGRASIK